MIVLGILFVVVLWIALIRESLAMHRRNLEDDKRFRQRFADWENADNEYFSYVRKLLEETNNGTDTPEMKAHADHLWTNAIRAEHLATSRRRRRSIVAVAPHNRWHE